MLKGPRQRHRELKDSAWTPLCQPLGDPVSLDLNSWTISSLQVIPNCAQLPPLTPSPHSFSAARGSAPAHMEAFVLFRSGGQKKANHSSLLPLVSWLSWETGQYREMFVPKQPYSSRNCDPAQESHFWEPHPVAASVCGMGQPSRGSPEQMAVRDTLMWEKGEFRSGLSDGPTLYNLDKAEREVLG